MRLPCLVRPYQKDDEGFVYKSWIDCLRASPPYQAARWDVIKRGFRQHISVLMERRASVLVATSEHESGEPKYGFICYEPGVLHFIYVRNAHRQKGYATQLMKKAGLLEGPVTASAWTRGLSYHQTRWRLTYDPFVAWETK